MSIIVSPDESALFTALGNVLIGMLPAGTEVVQAQVNRVPEPKAANYVVMTATRLGRLSTNIDAPGDVAFTASISGTTMHVTDIQIGTILDGATVFGTGVTPGTTVTGTLGGTGGTGDYIVSPSQIVPSQQMSSGHMHVTQPLDATVQLDVHGPNCGNNARIISTLFRDADGVRRFVEEGDIAAPLWAEDPRQIAFVNDQNQYESRWVVEVHLQVNETVLGIPQQFAGTLAVDLINVDAAYPPEAP